MSADRKSDTTDLPERNAEHYLGDGLFASFDGWCVWLRAPRDGGDHLVALEPETFRALRQWVSAHPKLAEHMGET